MESIFVIAAVIGFMEAVKAVKARDWETVAIIIGSATIGGVAGYLGIDNLTIENGIVAGLAASGTYKVGRIISGKE